MDKTLLRNFAIYSRNKLIEDIKSKANLLGISEESIKPPISKSDDMLVFDIAAQEPYQIHGRQVKQYKKLIEELKKREIETDYKRAYASLIEEVAYTWFNRIIAIRFMEVNSYLPGKTRVLSSGKTGVSEPEIIGFYEQSGLEFTDVETEKIRELKSIGSARAMSQLFQIIFVKECNRLNNYLPELFEKLDDYMELLLTISYIDESGVVYKLVNEIPETYFDIESENGHGQVEIIGWLYQYYNSEKNSEVIDVLKKGIISKEDIPAATQLFTTDWVVKYMVDNSLGKYWLERNSGSLIRNHLEFLLPGEINTVDDKISPQEIKIMDNAMGSGHCLAYAFDLLMEIYLSEGYMQRDAAKDILEKNLFGLDIDKRAYQLAYFTLLMKARRHNRKILEENISMNLAVFVDSESIEDKFFDYFGNSMSKEKKEKAIKEIRTLIKTFENATELGSILLADGYDKELIIEYMSDSNELEQINIDDYNTASIEDNIQKLIKLGTMLNNKYDVMVTNPPYLNKFGATLKKYINENYTDYKTDLFSVFIFRNLLMTKDKGYSAYMTPNVWMFIKTHQKLREFIIKDKRIDSLLQIARGSFYSEATVDVISFVLKNCRSSTKGDYIRLEKFKGNMDKQREKVLEAIDAYPCDYHFRVHQAEFLKIPMYRIAFWATENVISCFSKEKRLGEIIEPRQGLATADNNKFLRLWQEVDYNKINTHATSIKNSIESKLKWFPYNKGGPRRQWYGNYDYLVNWENDGREIRNFKDLRGKQRSVVRNPNYYFSEAISWPLITSGDFSIRYRVAGSIHDVSGMSAFGSKEKLMYIMGILSTKIAGYIFDMFNPTLNLQVGDFNDFPVIYKNPAETSHMIEDSILISKNDWDTFETSWDFVGSPLVDFNSYMARYYDCLEEKGLIGNREFFKIRNLEEAYGYYKEFTNNQFDKLKNNEEVLNRFFIGIYGLENELDSKVPDKDITITKIFDSEDEIDEEMKKNRYRLTKEKVIKQFISYAVGCMMGRYSLDVDGLIYAGGKWDDSKYVSYEPTEDNIILITDEPYLDNDIVSRFIKFIEVVYGQDSLEKNLDFIASALGGKGDSRELLRKYFFDDFFNEHVQAYHKRPIYWLYDAGAGKSKTNNQGSFKALVYLHRYNQDTTGKVRTAYLHKMQKMYEKIAENLNHEIEKNEGKKQAKAITDLEKINKQLKEIKDYDEKIAHLALRRIKIDLDDGVIVNYDKIQTDSNGKKLDILAKI